MIIIDTETTGLIGASSLPIEQQPHIIEFAAMRLDDNLELIGEITFMCNPGIPISPEITKITGIRQEDVNAARPFSAFYNMLCEAFLGESTIVAHNLAFDSGMLELELLRLGKTRQFPWPYKHVCTVERTQHFTGRYLKLEGLYQHLFNRPPSTKQHRAINDVFILAEIVRELRRREIV